MDIYTHHSNTAELERACAEATVFELMSSWIAAHASIDAVRELASRGFTEKNAQALVLEINMGIAAQLLEFRKRGINVPDINIKPASTPPMGAA